MLRTDIQYIYDNPLTIYPDLSDAEHSDLDWFIRLTSQQYFQKGYNVSEETHLDLDFPDYTMFMPNSSYDKDLRTLYNAFAWRGFLKYFKPTMQSGVLTGFHYDNDIQLSEKVIRTMLKFPTIDWVNSTLLNDNLNIATGLKDLINDSILDDDKLVSKINKAELARIFASLYLLDFLPFVQLTYEDNFHRIVKCITRSKELIKVLIENNAEAESAYTQMLNADKLEFINKGDLCAVCLTAEIDEVNNAKITYKPSLVKLETRKHIVTGQYVPFFQLISYCDGFSQRINDMPAKAAYMKIEFTKGVGYRYGTLSSQVMRQVYSGLDIMKTSARSKFKCGLDIADFGFKYFNLQGSIHTKRPWSGFSPFAIVELQDFDLSQLSKDVLNTSYDLITMGFKGTVDNADEKTLAKIAIACGINPERPKLRSLVTTYGKKKHPTELYKLMMANRKLFNI